MNTENEMFLGEKRAAQQAVAFSWENWKQLDKMLEWRPEEGKQNRKGIREAFQPISRTARACD